MNSKKSVGSAFSWAFLDRITTQGISTIVAIILARLIDPEHYGIIALASIVVDLLDVFVNPGICSSLVWKKDADDADYSSIFIFNIITSIVLYVAIFFTAPIISRFYEINQLVIVIRILALKLPFASLISVQMAYIQKNMIFKKYFFVSLFGTLSAGVVGIIMALSNYGVWALVVYSLANTVIDALLALVFIPWKPHFIFDFNKFKVLFGYGNKIFIVKLLDLTYEEISGLLIGKKYTTGDLACYKKGKKFPQMVVSNVSSSLSDVLFPAFSNLQDNYTEMRLMIRKSISISLYVLFPISFGLFACANTFINVLLTDKWLPCVPYLRIMCLNYICIVVAGVLLQSVKACGRSDVLLKLEIAKKTYSVILLIVALIAFNQPIYIAYAVVLSTVISLILDIVVVRHLIELEIVQLFKDNIKTIIIGIVMTIAVLLMENLEINSVLLLILQILCGVAVYILLSIIFKSKQFKDLLNIIRTRLRRG